MAHGGIKIVGPAGLTRDVVSGVLATAPSTEADVCVLAEPEPDHWDEARSTGAPIVLVAEGPLDGEAAVAAVANGADGVVDPAFAPTQLLDSIRVVADGGTALAPRHAKALVRAVRAGPGGATDAVPRLTSREVDILQGIAQGQSLKQTADALGVARKTVENLQRGLLRKLQARNRPQAVVRAHAYGLLAEEAVIPYD